MKSDPLRQSGLYGGACSKAGVRIEYKNKSKFDFVVQIQSIYHDN